MKVAVPFILETPRLTLREATMNDAAFILELMNERAFIENIGDRGVRTETDARAYIEAKYLAVYRTWGYGLYVVEMRTPMMPIGVCGFVKREMLAHADLGFAFLAPFRGLGYGFEAAVDAVAHARDSLHFERLFGVTAPTNAASIGLLKKIGMTYRETVRLPGNTGDSFLFAIDFTSPHATTPTRPT